MIALSVCVCIFVSVCTCVCVEKQQKLLIVGDLTLQMKSSLGFNGATFANATAK